MAKHSKTRNTRPMKKKPQSNTQYIVIGLIVVVVLICGYLFLGTEGSKMSSGSGLQDYTKYDTMMRNNAFRKRGELRESGRNDDQIQRQVRWLSKSQTLTSLIPWESTYLAAIPEEDINSNQAFSNLRIDLIQRFESIRNKFDDAIGDPSDANIAEAINTLRENKQLIRSSIQDVRSSSINNGHQESIIKMLNLLLSEMDSQDYE